MYTRTKSILINGVEDVSHTLFRAMAERAKHCLNVYVRKLRKTIEDDAEDSITSIADYYRDALDPQEQRGHNDAAREQLKTFLRHVNEPFKKILSRHRSTLPFDKLNSTAPTSGETSHRRRCESSMSGAWSHGSPRISSSTAAMFPVTEELSAQFSEPPATAEASTSSHSPAGVAAPDALMATNIPTVRTFEDLKNHATLGSDETWSRGLNGRRRTHDSIDAQTQGSHDAHLPIRPKKRKLTKHRVMKFEDTDEESYSGPKRKFKSTRFPSMQVEDTGGPVLDHTRMPNWIQRQIIKIEDSDDDKEF
jgi:hypothetical protein